MSGCNCSKPKPGTQSNGGGLAGQTQSFTLQTDDGKTQRFGSRLEAQAAAVRAGGGTISFG